MIIIISRNVIEINQTYLTSPDNNELPGRTGRKSVKKFVDPRVEGTSSRKPVKIRIKKRRGGGERSKKERSYRN